MARLGPTAHWMPTPSLIRSIGARPWGRPEKPDKGLAKPVPRRAQAPEVWAGLLTEAGFSSPRIRWSSFYQFRRPGRLLLGNRLAAYFLQSHFCLTMVKTSPALSAGE